MFRPVIWAVTGLLSACLACAAPARATTVTPDLEFIQLPSVSGSWQTVTLTNSYSSPVVVCTYNLPSKSSPPALVRVRSAAAGSFQVKLQRFENSSMVTAAPVHCIIADEGVYTLPNGLKFEAHKVLSDGTSGQNAANGWNLSATEEVTSTLGHTYSSPVVLGQVMTENDARASVFWTQNCAARGSAPLTNGRLCVGKHIGQLSGSRANETLGYIVAEGGSGTVNGVQYTLAPGGNSIAGVGNSPPYSYTAGLTGSAVYRIDPNEIRLEFVK